MEKIELKHTPGPWAVEVTKYAILINCTVDGIDHCVVTDRFCYPGFAQHGDSVKLANAHLIAAAPLLLSALMKAVEQEDKNAHQFFLQLPPYTPGEYVFPDWYYDAKDAIAKATNTTQP